jgi:hypothetical protein
MTTNSFACLGVRFFAVFLALAGLRDATSNVQTHFQSEAFAMQKELMEEIDGSLKKLEATMRETMPDAPRPTGRSPSLENIERINARVYDWRFYTIIVYSSAGTLGGLLLFLWPAKAARSVGHGLVESMDPVSAARCLLRLFGMYFVIITFLSFLTVALTSLLVPLLKLDFTVLLYSGIHFGLGVTILLCDRLLARLFLWKLG